MGISDYTQFSPPKKPKKKPEKNTAATDATDIARQRTADGKGFFETLFSGSKFTPAQRRGDAPAGNRAGQRGGGVNLNTLFTGKIAPEDQNATGARSMYMRTGPTQEDVYRGVENAQGVAYPKLIPSMQRTNREKPGIGTDAVGLGHLIGDSSPSDLWNAVQKTRQGIFGRILYGNKGAEEREDQRELNRELEADKSLPMEALPGEGITQLAEIEGARTSVSPRQQGGLVYTNPKGTVEAPGGRLSPEQLSEAGYNPANMSGSFGVMPSSNALGVDTSAMKPEERSAFNVKSYNDAADKLVAERESKGGGRMTPSGGQRVSSFDRDMLLKSYKRDLRGVMGETGHYGGTKKAKIKAINEYYKSALGLGVGDQEEAGRTDRANIVADAALEREGITQAGRMAATRMTADSKANKVEIDQASGQPFILTANGREWTNTQMLQMAAQWKTLEGKDAEKFADQFLKDYNMLPNEVN